MDTGGKHTATWDSICNDTFTLHHLVPVCFFAAVSIFLHGMKTTPVFDQVLKPFARLQQKLLFSYLSQNTTETLFKISLD